MLTLSTFRAMFPEFRDVGDSLITSTLTAAEALIGPDFLSSENRAHGLATAAMLSRGAQGKGVRLAADKAVSTYDVELRKLQQVAALGKRVF